MLPQCRLALAAARAPTLPIAKKPSPSRTLVREAIADFAPKQPPASLSKDLEQILAVVEEIRFRPDRLRLVFACNDHSVWHEFDLPSTEPLSILRTGRRFHLEPLMLALQSIVPYCVAVIESGKVRVFIVRGSEIEEITEELEVKERAPETKDPRVGWSRHANNRRAEHERGYFKDLSHQLLRLVLKREATGMVIGCREDLWGEVEPQFTDLERVLMGRFHLPHFEAAPAKLLRMARPIFAETRRTRLSAALREINETPSRGTWGVSDVLRALLAGSVQSFFWGTCLARRFPNARPVDGCWPTPVTIAPLAVMLKCATWLPKRV